MIFIFSTHRSFSERLELDVEILSYLLVGWVELLCDEIPRVRTQRLVVHPDGDFSLKQTLLLSGEKLSRQVLSTI